MKWLFLTYVGKVITHCVDVAHIIMVWRPNSASATQSLIATVLLVSSEKTWPPSCMAMDNIDHETSRWLLMGISHHKSEIPQRWISRTAGVVGENNAILVTAIGVLLLGHGWPGLPQARGVQDGTGYASSISLVEKYTMRRMTSLAVSYGYIFLFVQKLYLDILSR